MDYVIRLILVCIVAWFVLRYFAKRGRAKAPVEPSALARLPYVKCTSLLTAGEMAYFRELLKVTSNQFYVLAKVRLADIILVSGNRYTKGWQGQFNRVQSKHVDFLLCDPGTLAPRLIIKLNDSSHREKKRQIRDELLNSLCAEIGLPILHVPANPAGYHADSIREEIESRLSAFTTLDLQKRDVSEPVAR